VSEAPGSGESRTSLLGESERALRMRAHDLYLNDPEFHAEVEVAVGLTNASDTCRGVAVWAAVLALALRDSPPLPGAQEATDGR
jgi:hypothetical protein